MNDIRARLSSTSNSWIGAIIFVMNLIRHMRDIPLSYFVSFLSKLMKVRNINIYPVKQTLDTVTTDFYKSVWEDMPGKSVQELHTTEGDVLFSRSLSVISGNEGHFFIRDIHDKCLRVRQERRFYR